MSKRKMTFYSAEEKANFLAKQTASGLTAAAFCRKHGIASTTFFQWRKQERESNSLSSFVEVEIPQTVSSPAAGIHCASLTLTSPESLSLESLTTVLTAMQRSVQ